MRELFKKSLENPRYITKDEINKLNKKTYFNGEDIKEGDNLIFALLIKDDCDQIYEPELLTPPMTTECQGNNMVEMELIVIKEEHFDMFEPYNPKIYQNTKIPVIILK
jgi:hypothetical protein